MIRLFTLALITCLMPLSTWAQPVQEVKSDETPQVRVEVIIFQSLALRGWTEEYWPDIYELPQIENVRYFNATDGYARLLPQEQLTLNNDVAKMTTEKGYDVLAHFGWQQPTLPKDQAEPVLIDQSVQQSRMESSILFGTIRFYQERFAHIEVDIELDRQIPERIRDDFARHQQIDADWMTEGWRFQLKESRRIRPGELHYLDHPIFGVLVKFERVESKPKS